MLPEFLTHTLRISILLGSVLFAQSASASFHLWQLSELYSNSSGTVQYIELSTSAGGQEFVSGHAISASQGASIHTFSFPTDLPGDTSDHKFLIGTQGFASLGIVTPDYIVPNGFLFQPNGSVNFAGVDSVTYSALPTDGVHALNRNGNSVVNAPANFSGITGSIPTMYQDLWWNPNESGWGMSLTQHGSTIANAMYTYDQNGQPTWYTMACTLAGTSCTGNIYRVSGGTQPTVPWNGSGKMTSSAGSGTLSFTDANTGTFTFTLNDLTGSKSISRMVFATGSTPVVDYTDLWWNPNESGWGVALTQQYGLIAATWYSYDATGKAVWYVGTCTVSGSGCSTTDLYQVSGGSPLTSVWHATNPLTRVGTISFAFTDASNGTMSYNINGETGSRSIMRLSF